MKNLNYNRPIVSDQWTQSHETHRAVAMAIHAIADKNRDAESIWSAPTPAEWQNVQMALESYVRNGIFDQESDGYQWGLETIFIAESNA